MLNTAGSNNQGLSNMEEETSIEHRCKDHFTVQITDLRRTEPEKLFSLFAVTLPRTYSVSNSENVNENARLFASKYRTIFVLKLRTSRQDTATHLKRSF